MDFRKEIVSMDNELFELLKQANETAKQLNVLANRINRMDTVITALGNDKGLVICGFEIQGLFGDDVANAIRQSIMSSLTEVKNKNKTELKQMLGQQQEKVTVIKNCITGEEITVKIQMKLLTEK